MNVSACLVTRGDVDMTPIIDSLTASGIDDIVVWDNSKGKNLSVYGRYAGIEHAKHDLILVQDDDCVLPPESIQTLVREWEHWASHGAVRQGSVRQGQAGFGEASQGEVWQGVVCNMPEAWRRQPFYSDHALIGFGSVFHRDAPKRAFDLWTDFFFGDPGDEWLSDEELGAFNRTCDIVFTALIPRVLLDLPYENLPWAEDESRMYRQNGHVAERTRMLELVRQVRDAD